MQKLLSLTKSCLLIFAFIACTFCVISRKLLPRPMSSVFFFFFSVSSSFILPNLMFKSLIHFEIIFVSGVRKSPIYFLQVVIQFCQQHLLNRLSFLHWVFLASLSKINWLLMEGFIFKLSILFHWLMCEYIYIYIYIFFFFFLLVPYF